MADTIRSVLAFIVVLGVLVFFHELGHYTAARARGVVVEAFSIGFGPALISWRAKSGTLWKISALPLGGYVKMQGWGEEQTSDPIKPGSFAATSLGSKALIVAAGPIANLLLAFVLFYGLFVFAGQMVVQPVLSKVIASGPAAQAGLLQGDRILAVGDQHIVDFSTLQTIIVAHPNSVLDLSISRNGTTQNLQVRSGARTVDGRIIGMLGVEGDQTTLRHFNPITAIRPAGLQTWETGTAILGGIWNLIAHHQGVRDLSGPLGIAQLSGRVAALGVVSLISFMAMLSVNLGLVNLIPIPVLDGGHLLFYAGELIYGKPIPRQAQEMGLRLGFALLLSLFVFTTFNDLSRLGAVTWVAHLFG